MCFNAGKIDRIVRVVVGIAIIGWGVATQNYWGAVGLVPLLTGAVGFCPLYPILKLNTGCNRDQQEQS